jgi:hypothetical protein
MNRGICYLLHFDAPIGDLANPRGQAQHYLGWTRYLPARALAHLRGGGARLTQVACERQIGFVISRTWPGDRHFERKLKNQHAGPRLCPICQAARNPPAAAREDLL